MTGLVGVLAFVAVAIVVVTVGTMILVVVGTLFDYFVLEPRRRRARHEAHHLQRLREAADRERVA